jgi:hypothetical protein
MSSRHLRLFGLGSIVSAILLYFALRNLDWRELYYVLRGIDLLSFVFCFVFLAFGIVVRALRWSLITGRELVFITVFVRATNLGILGNQILPARLGEVVRVIALKRLLRCGLSEAVGSAFIDRVVDIAVLFLSACIVSVLIVGTRVPQSWLIGLGVALLVFVFSIAVLRTKYADALLTYISERILYRWSLSPASFLSVFNAMTVKFFRLKTFSPIFLVACLVLLADYLAVMAALWSVGLELPLSAPLILWVMLAAGSALPSAPGYLGVYQMAAILALSNFETPVHQAVAVSLVLQVLTLLVSIIGAGSEIRFLWSSTEQNAQ